MASNNLCMNKKFNHGHKHGKCLIQLHLKPTGTSLIHNNNIPIKQKPQIKTRPSLNIVHSNSKKNAVSVSTLNTQSNQHNPPNAVNRQRLFSNGPILTQQGNPISIGSMGGPPIRRGGGCGCGR